MKLMVTLMAHDDFDGDVMKLNVTLMATRGKQMREVESYRGCHVAISTGLFIVEFPGIRTKDKL